MQTASHEIAVEQKSDGSMHLAIPAALATSSRQILTALLTALNNSAEFGSPISVRVSEIPRMRISKSELAERLGISPRTIDHWKDLHIIPYEKIGRVILFDVAAVDGALKRFRRLEVGNPDYRMKRRIGRIEPRS